jgi:hypothetical protein
MIVRIVVALLLAGVLCAAAVCADEAPISGTVTSVDPAANTVTLESTAKGKTRTIVVYLEPGAKIVKFTRSTEPARRASSSNRSRSPI